MGPFFWKVENMSWSPQQEEALAAVGRWIKDPNGQQIFRLFGYAGTGKTTLAKHFAETSDDLVRFAAFTGKAALVLRQKGCDASTIHSLIYVPKGKSPHTLTDLKARLKEVQEKNGSPHLIEKLEAAIYREVNDLKAPYFELNPMSELYEGYVGLIIIDECSMVNEEMALDLLSFDIPILVLGDPAQLPPVKGGGYFTDHKPDFMLTEIHRQAKDNPIIEMSRIVREGESLPLGRYGNCSVISRRNILDPLIYDQLLCGKNITRHTINDRMRVLQGYEGDVPMEDEKLVCLRNNKDDGLLNGGLWNVVEGINTDLDQVILSINSDDGEKLTDIRAWKDIFRHEEHTMGPWDRADAHEFDFGYALTCHKAQGSQWNNVMVMDESHVFKSKSKNWLYTAITRAAEKVDIVR
jgi:exodeoxyribonuclease-5